MSAVTELLESRASDAEQQAARYRKMADLVQELGDDGLGELISLLAVKDNSDPTHNGNGHNEPERVPRGREAVRRIVQERPGIWTLAELRAEMQERGWFTSSKGLEVAVIRLCGTDGEGRRIGKGRYVFPANHGEEDAIESDPSDGATIPSMTML